MSSIFGAPIQSENDKRKYRLVTLANQLDVLLVEDEEATRSACGADVAIGSFADPAEAQGLAHFLEHMLFMGSETYPDENEYSQFLSSHGGSSNAYTTHENTVYYFDVQNDALEEAMKRFSAFFVCPLFLESSVDREIEAVDNENSKNLQSDLWRRYQLLQGLCKQEHPLNMFATGNATTLRDEPKAAGVDMRQLLLDFHANYYSANVMKVVIYGKDSLDVMQGWAESMFGLVRNSDVPTYRVPPVPYGVAETSKLLSVKPVKDVKQIEVTIPLKEQNSNYRSKPGSVISHLIGHEGGGSVLAALKARGLANDLSCYVARSFRDFAMFEVSISLTDEGVSNTDEVLACFWAYVGMLQREGPKDWIAQEVQHISALSFRFLSKEEPSNYASRTAANMHLYDKEDVLCGGETISEILHDLYTETLSRFNVKNSITSVRHQGLAKESLPEVEKWYGTEYGRQDYSAEQVALWEEALAGRSSWSKDVALPMQNPFVPSNFDLAEVHESRKCLLNEDNFARPVLLERKEVHLKNEEGSEYLTSDEEVAEALLSTSFSSEQQNGDAAEAEPEEESAAEDGGDEAEAEEEEPASAAEPALEQPTGCEYNTWYLQDAKWGLPKTYVQLELQFWDTYSSAATACLASLYADIVEDLVNEFSYYADCAGLYFSIKATTEGLAIGVSGYTHKLQLLLEKILDQMMALKLPGAVPPETFQRIKERLKRSYKNKKFIQPYQKCMLGMDECLLAPRWDYDARLSRLSTLTQGDFERFSASLFESAFARVLVSGNATPGDARRYTAFVRTKIDVRPLLFSEMPHRRTVALVPGVEYVYRQFARHNNPDEPNSAIKNSYMIGSRGGFMPGNSIEENAARVELLLEAKVKLLALMISEPAFDQLRTKEQLGYIASAYNELVGTNMSISFVVQSNSRSASFLDGRIEAFLDSYRVILEAMTAEEFAQFNASCISDLRMQPKNSNEEVRGVTAEMANGTFLFSRKKTLAVAVKDVTKTDLLAFYDEFMQGPRRRKFSSQFYGNKHRCVRDPKSSRTLEVVHEASKWKQRMTLQPTMNYEECCPVQDFRE